MAALGTLKAKVLIQIGDGEPIEVGTMDIDLVAKPQTVRCDSNGEFIIALQTTPTLDLEAIEQSITNRLTRLGVGHG